MPRLIAVAAVLALAAPVAAGESPGPDARAKVIAPFVDGLTVAVLRVDLSRIDVDALATRLGKLGTLMERDLEEARRFKQALVRGGVREVYGVVTLADGPPATVFLVAPLDDQARPDDVTAAMREVGRGSATEQIRRAVVMAPTKGALKRIRNLKPAPVPDLGKALAASGDAPVTAVAVMPPAVGKALEEPLAELPPPFDASVKVVPRYTSWAAAGIELTPRLSFRAVVQARNADSARALERFYQAALDTALQQAERHKAVPNAGTVRELLTPKQAEDRLTLALNDRELADVLAPVVANLRAAAGRAQSTSNLRVLALAIISYADANRRSFPAAAFRDKKGRPLLSWRVHILPYIEQQSLYREFRLNEPWDSEHNKKLIARMPAFFLSPNSNAGPGKTTYLAPVGKDTVFPPDRAIVFPSSIPDGVSNTLMLLEADDDSAVIWTKPDDLPYDPKQPFRGLPSGKGKSFLAAFADGSVRTLPGTIQPDVLRALFTRNGGELMDVPDDE
jgi:hypothetical protein